MADDIETRVTLAKMGESLQHLAAGIEEIKESVKSAACASSDAVSKSSMAMQKAEAALNTTTTVFARIDEGRNERASLTEFTNQLKGAGKAATLVFGLLQAIFMALMIWVLSSVSTLRENRAVLDFRIQQLEMKCSPSK